MPRNARSQSPGPVSAPRSSTPSAAHPLFMPADGVGPHVGRPPGVSRRQLLAAAVAALALPAASRRAHAQETTAPQGVNAPQGAEPFVPRVGQSGKDVVWVPTPETLVQRMLRMAEVGPRDYVVDLGAGDGKIVIAAARDFGARSLGVEFNPDMVRLARSNALAAGTGERARIEQGDIFAFDFGTPTVVTMYLLPNLNLRLRPRLLGMAPGTRVVSHQFTMGEWEADEETLLENRSAYLWIVPANAGGNWKLNWRDPGGNGGMDATVEQTFQKIKGTARAGDLRISLRAPQLYGDRIRFDLMDDKGVLRSFEGRVEGNTMRGTTLLRSAAGGASGDRAARGSGTFSAPRSGEAPPIAS